MNDNAKREQELAKQAEMALNSYSFNPKLFAAAIPTMHRTLQQSLWRLIKECVKVFADENTGHDDRNMASHMEAKEMLEYFKLHGRHIPFV